MHSAAHSPAAASVPVDSETELRVPPQPLWAVLGVIGYLITLTAEFSPARDGAAMFGLLILALAACGLFLAGDHRRLSAWALVTIVVAGVLFTQLTFNLAGLLPLLAIPTILTAMMLGRRAMLAAALGETLVVVVAERSFSATISRPEMLVALAVLWLAAGTIYLLYTPIYDLETWLWEYFAHAQRSLEEARERRAELEQALADLEHANRQLALTNARLAAARLAAEEVQKSKAAFVAKVSHEFRTPLNMIIGLLGLLVEAPDVYGQELPPGLFEDLKIVRRNCDHLSSMVNDVLDLSQAEAGRLVLRRERVRLGNIVSAALEVVQPLLQKKGLSIDVRIPADIPEIYCDQTRIRQVILNLVSNAARFTEQGGIAIQVERQAGTVVVSVADTGPGIPPENAERIFEPFNQATDGAWRDRRGSGLGLSISKQFIELHGGRIWLESKVGLGTTFFFELPISLPETPLAQPWRWISEDWDWVARTSRPILPGQPPKPRVVVCDEDGEICSALARASDEAEFVDTRNLEQAVGALQQCPAHALLLNTAAADLWPSVERARQLVADTPIIACSVSPQLQRARDAGAANYLTRPVSGPSLRVAIADLGRPVQRILIVDDDPDVRQLLARMLAGNGLEIYTASNGEQGLQELRESPPDLMLLDVVMPGLDGWQVLDLKRREAAIRDIPVIMVSAQNPSEKPRLSEGMLVTMGEGLSLDRLLQCTLQVAALAAEARLSLPPSRVSR